MEPQTYILDAMRGVDRHIDNDGGVVVTYRHRDGGEPFRIELIVNRAEAAVLPHHATVRVTIGGDTDPERLLHELTALEEPESLDGAAPQQAEEPGDEEEAA